MNTQTNDQQLALANAFGVALAARLSEGSENLSHHASERLKVALAQAVANRRIVSLQLADSVSISGGEVALKFGGREDGLWNRIASVLPLVVLIAGLISIALLQDDVRAREVAAVDAELLIDELPPSAFIDPGFAQYLRANQSNQ
jgi:hypothetical protein